MCLKKSIVDEIKKYYIEKKCESNKEMYIDKISNYIEYYHLRAWKCKMTFYSFNVIKIVSVASIPVLQAWEVTNAGPYIVMASAVSILMESLIALFHLHDKWSLYRGANNALLKEKREYDMGQGKYKEKEDEDEKFTLFFHEVEEIISNEGEKWSKIIKEKKVEEKP